MEYLLAGTPFKINGFEGEFIKIEEVQVVECGDEKVHLHTKNALVTKNGHPKGKRGRLAFFGPEEIVELIQEK